MAGSIVTLAVSESSLTLIAPTVDDFSFEFID